MNKNDYWLRRRDQLFLRESQDATKRLARTYKRLYDQTASDLLSLLAEIEKGIIHEGGINERDVLVSDLYKCKRYYELISNFSKALPELQSKQNEIFEQKLTSMYNNQSQLITNELGETKSFSLEKPQDILKTINAVWAGDGKNWSNRIWINNQKMEEELRNGITDIIARGVAPDKIAVKLTQFTEDEFNKAFNRAQRLVNTELSYVQTQATLQKYEEAGIKYYEILAANGACSDCANEYNGQIYRLDQAKVGINCPPFHPNCRCTTMAVKGD